jgi:hypothetical protein
LSWKNITNSQNSVRKKSFGGTFTFSNCHIIGLSLVLVLFLDLLLTIEPTVCAAASKLLPSKDTSGDLVDPKSLYYSTIYEVEVWLKHSGTKGTSHNKRNKYDLVAKCHPKKDDHCGRSQRGGSLPATFEVGDDEDGGGGEAAVPEAAAAAGLTAVDERHFEADRDYKAHTTVVLDMSNYLKKRGVQHPEDYLSLPIRLVIVLL